MSPDRRVRSTEPEWCDVVMRMLPGMYRLGEVIAQDDYLFVYSTTYFSVKEELRRGATDQAIRRQRSQILRFIDKADRSDYDKELFAATFARAVDDALDGRAPCVLQAPDCSAGAQKMPPALSIGIGDLLDRVQ
jgi:hypothetical protein